MARSWKGRGEMGASLRGGAAAPLCVTFGSDAAAREAALLGRVEVPRAGGGPPWQVGLFFKGASLGQPPLVLPGEPWDVCAGGREEQGGGSVVRLMAAFGARHPGDAALREEVGDALRVEYAGGRGPALAHVSWARGGHSRSTANSTWSRFAGNYCRSRRSLT